MPRKKAEIILNPHGGQTLAHLPDVQAILAAAGWKTRLAIKEYGGHAQELAQEAAEQGVDLLIAYGGDGTLNQVVNGAMNAGHQGVVGVLPGGTANVWATEVRIPAEAVKAALKLVNSAARPVDVGHVSVTSLMVPEMTSEGEQQAKKAEKRKSSARRQARQHFLLMAGLGIDAAVMGAVSKPLKYRLGPLAVGLAALKEMPDRHVFPLEIRRIARDNRDEVLWKGEALQVIIGNTRLYARVVEMTPDALIDDGLLDVCVITAGEPLTTLQQITSLLLRRAPAEVTADYFWGAHLALSVPAWVPLQVDGSAVKLKDYLSQRDRQRLQQAEQPDEVIVKYRFDVRPRALQVAIPRDYDDELFQQKQAQETAQPLTTASQGATLRQEASSQPAADHADTTSGAADATEKSEQPELLELVKMLGEQGQTVKVFGVSVLPGMTNTAVIAGSSLSQKTGESKPVAIQVDEKTIIVTSAGKLLSPAALVTNLEEGKEVVVVGKKNKRGAIKATRLLI